MTKKIFTTLLYITFCHALFSQTISIEYSKKSHIDPASFYGLPELMKKDALATRYFTLIVSNNQSLYYKTPGQDPIIDIPIKQKGQYISYADESYYYKNFTEDLMLFELPNDYNTTKGKDKLPVYEWDTRSEETKRIKGYKCKRATLWKDKILYIAYYTTELPVGNGPGRFGGLPGTILMLKFKQQEYIAKSIRIKKENTAIDRPVFTGETLTYAEYLAKAEERRKAEQEKYPVKDYGAVKLILKTEAEAAEDEKRESVKE